MFEMMTDYEMEKTMEKVSTVDIGGEVVKEDERYIVKDNKLLKKLMFKFY